MAQPLTLERDEYLALSNLARAGKNSAQLRDIESWLQNIERKNGVQRYVVRVRWTEPLTPVSPNVNFPHAWPPTQETTIERFDRPVAKADVQLYLNNNAKNPTEVFITKDIGGELGWTRIEDFFR